MCTCTEPVKTGIGAVCVEYGRPKWPITQTDISGTEKYFVFYFWHPMLVRPAMKRLFCLKAKNVLGRFALSALPHSKNFRVIFQIYPINFISGSIIWLVAG